jgi:hypothetical protein
MNSQTTLRRAVLGCVVAIAVATSAGCAEIESVTAEPYEPAALESTGPDKPARIILTDQALGLHGGRASDLPACGHRH